MAPGKFEKFSLQGIDREQAQALLDDNRVLFNRAREDMTTSFKLVLSAIEKRAEGGSPSSFEYHALGRAGEHITAQFDAFNGTADEAVLTQIHTFYNAAQVISVALGSSRGRG